MDRSPEEILEDIGPSRLGDLDLTFVDQQDSDGMVLILRRSKLVESPSFSAVSFSRDEIEKLIHSLKSYYQ